MMLCSLVYLKCLYGVFVTRAWISCICKIECFDLYSLFIFILTTWHIFCQIDYFCWCWVHVSNWLPDMLNRIKSQNAMLCFWLNHAYLSFLDACWTLSLKLRWLHMQNRPSMWAHFCCIPIIWNEYADWTCIIHEKMGVIVMRVSQWQSPLPLYI